jgi:hypothetical protein
MHMLEALRLEAAQVELTLTTGDKSAEPIPKVGGRYTPAANQFVALRARVQNLTGMLSQLNPLFAAGVTD